LIEGPEHDARRGDVTIQRAPNEPFDETSFSAGVIF
jgi:hypothetical protein